MTIYTTNCPKCKVLEAKLKKKQIDYTSSTNIEKILKLGYQTAPILEYNNQYYTFEEAIELLKTI